MSVDTTELQKNLNMLHRAEVDYVNHMLNGSRYLKESDGTIVILTPEGNKMPIPVMTNDEDDFEARESHIIKAISHHFALPEADLIKAINDYKEGRNA